MTGCDTAGNAAGAVKWPSRIHKSLFLPAVMALASSALPVMQHARIGRIVAPLYGGIGSILMFHRVVPEALAVPFSPNARLSVTAAFFDRVVRHLLEQGYELVTLSEAHARLMGGKSGRRFACLTFDDGYRDNYEAALPICRSYGVPMTVFVATGFVDRHVRDWSPALEALVAASPNIAFRFAGREWHLPSATTDQKLDAYRALHRMFAGLTPEEEDALAQELRARCGVDLAGIADAVFMTWDMITAMDREGIVEIGAHSVSHRPLRGLTEEEARREMADSRARLQAHVRQQVAHFAYPFGGRAHASHREFRLACGAGFATAVTTRHGNVMPAHRYAPHALPRLSVHGRLQTLAALDLMLSGATSALANGFRRVVTV